MNSSVEVADPLPAQDLPSASSPKFKTANAARIHKQGCPPDMRISNDIKTMKLTYKIKYKSLSDKEIVDLIIAEPHNEEAAIYLIYDRYKPLCISICLKTLGSTDRLDELQSELFMLLKGKNRDWHALRSFGWRSTLGRWLSITAYNLSLELRRQLIENDGNNTSIDDGWTDEDNESHIIEIPDDDEKQQARRYNMMVLNEAIHMLENPDQRFVIKRRLQGYSSKEVAEMLQAYWNENGIVRYNNKRETVKPDSGYIDNLFKRGYDKAAAIYKKLNR